MGFFRDLFRELTKPKPATGDPIVKEISDPAFGALVWDSDSGWWTGIFACPGMKPFRLTVDAGSELDRRPSPVSRERFDAVREKIAGCKQQAIEDFLPTFNEHWNEGTPWTARQMSDMLEPDTVNVWDHGDVEVSFQEVGDTEWLGGHVLMVSFHLDGSTTIGLEG